MKSATKLACGVILAMALSIVTASAQSITLSGANPSITENFDSMGSTGTTPPTGWFVGTSLSGSTSGTNGTFTAGAVTVGTGSSTTGANYNFGVAGVNPITDRALGSVASGTGNTRVTEARFYNNTSLTITGMVVTYTGEEWRNGGNASQATQELSLHASLGGSTFTALGASFNFTSPTVGPTATALDGNASANRTTGIGGSVNLTSLLGGLANGGTLYLRWVDVNDAGNDHGLAIDDLNISFLTVPEPSTVLLVSAGLVGLLAIRRRRS